MLLQAAYYQDFASLRYHSINILTANSVLSGGWKPERSSLAPVNQVCSVSAFRREEVSGNQCNYNGDRDDREKNRILAGAEKDRSRDCDGDHDGDAATANGRRGMAGAFVWLIDDIEANERFVNREGQKPCTPGGKDEESYIRHSLGYWKGWTGEWQVRT